MSKVTFTETQLQAGIKLNTKEPLRIKIADKAVSCIHMHGMFFAYRSTLPLPNAIDGLNILGNYCANHSTPEVLIVTHADDGLDSTENSELTINRAETIKAFILGDANSILNNYNSDQPWGGNEDLLMLSALPDGDIFMDEDNPILSYQHYRGLTALGYADEDTRTQLIAEYLGLITNPTPNNCNILACGQGNQHEENSSAPEGLGNNKLELFVFDNNVQPPPSNQSSPNDSYEYYNWLEAITSEETLTQPHDELEFEWSI